MTGLAKWATPERQECLIKLWVQYGNQCLLGHRACPIREHYTHLEPRLIRVPKPILQACKNKDGNPIYDARGNLEYIKVYPLVGTIQPIKTECRLYELKSEKLIKDWIADDKAQRQAEYQAEYEARHNTRERTYPLHGRFSAISQEIFYDTQPEYYLENVGISGLTFKPFARLRLASSPLRLHVDLGDSFKGMSKCKRRKAVRYGKIPKDLEDRINDACWKAVKVYLNQ
jgi:hypothetical protein